MYLLWFMLSDTVFLLGTAEIVTPVGAMKYFVAIVSNLVWFVDLAPWMTLQKVLQLTTSRNLLSWSGKSYAKQYQNKTTSIYLCWRAEFRYKGLKDNSDCLWMFKNDKSISNKAKKVILSQLPHVYEIVHLREIEGFFSEILNTSNS